MTSTIEEKRHQILRSLNLEPARMSEETFEDYKIRQKLNSIIMRYYKKGLVFTSNLKGVVNAQNINK